MLLLLLAVSLFLAAPYEPLIGEEDPFQKDFGDIEPDSPDLVEIAIEDFQPLKGVPHSTKCEEFKKRCKKFILARGNLKSHLIAVKELREATWGLRGADIGEETNPCVGMYAFCIPATYKRIKKALKLKHPMDY